MKRKPEIRYIVEFKNGKDWFWLNAVAYHSKTKAIRELNDYRKSSFGKEVSIAKIVKQVTTFRTIAVKAYKQ